MELVQPRVVTLDVVRSAGFYAALTGVSLPLNEFYVEIPVGEMTVGFSRCCFTEDHGPTCRPVDGSGARAGEMILDFSVADVDEELDRVTTLGVEMVLPPTTQPWGTRSMLFRDPDGRLVNVFSRVEEGR